MQRQLDRLIAEIAQGESFELSAQQLADSAGVTLRTLHHYDEIGLLRAAVRDSRGRRMYHNAQILQLAHILWLRQLDYPLERIRLILKHPNSGVDFLKMQEVSITKKIEKLEVERLKMENSIHLLEGIKEIQNQGSSLPDMQALMEAAQNMVDEVHGGDTWADLAAWGNSMSAEDAVAAAAKALDQVARIRRVVEAELPADSPEVQELIAEIVAQSEAVLDMSKEQFLAYLEMSKPGSEMASMVDSVCPGWAALYYKAAGIYAQNHWPNHS